MILLYTESLGLLNIILHYRQVWMLLVIANIECNQVQLLTNHTEKVALHPSTTAITEWFRTDSSIKLQIPRGTSDLLWTDHKMKICNKTRTLIGVLYWSFYLLTPC